MSRRVLVCLALVFQIPGVGTATATSDHELKIVNFEEVEIITQGASAEFGRADCGFVDLREMEEPDEDVLRLLDKGRSFVPSRRIEAAAELYENGIETAEEVDAVSAWLDRENEPWVRRYLVMTLLDLDDEILMVDLLASEDSETRSIVAKYIIEAVDIGVGLESILIETYRPDDPWWVRIQFLAAFGEGIRDESLRILHEALEDRVRDVRGAAVMALEYRDDPRSLDHLLAMMDDPDLIGTDSPLEGIASLSGSSQIPWVEEAAWSESPAVRTEAANALGNLCARGSEETLSRLLNDRHRSVVDAAAEALKKLGIETLVDPDDSSSQRFLVTSLDTLAPGARIVVPSQGEKAEAWEVAPGLDYDESRHEVRAGSIAVVEEGASFRGETWLLVGIEEERVEGWMRERDLRRLTRQEALAIVNRPSH